MRVTIVVPDNTVLIDGEARPVDCSSAGPGVRVVQWYETAGWIEFNNQPDAALRANQPGAEFRPNQPIESLEPWVDIIEAWYAYTPPPTG